MIRKTIDGPQSFANNNKLSKRCLKIRHPDLAWLISTTISLLFESYYYFGPSVINNDTVDIQPITGLHYILYSNDIVFEKVPWPPLA